MPTGCFVERRREKGGTHESSAEAMLVVHRNLRRFGHRLRGLYVPAPVAAEEHLTGCNAAGQMNSRAHSAAEEFENVVIDQVSIEKGHRVCEAFVAFERGAFDESRRALAGNRKGNGAVVLAMQHE